MNCQLRNWPARSRVCAAATLVLFLAAIPTYAADEFVVRDIRIEGLMRISEGTVFNYLPINIGDTLDQQRVQEALRAVFATGFFKDVEFRRDGSTLVIAVLERPSIASFSISGNKDIKTEDLEEPLANIGLKVGRIFDRAVLDEVERSLTDQYYSQGKYGAQISTEVEELPDNNVGISINIKEGDRAKIRQINIVGNYTFPDEDILENMELQTPNWLSWIRQDDRYSREALSGDLEMLRSYYMDRGFADFSLESTQVAISPDKKDIFITINVVEGDRYVVSDVKLAGDLVLSPDQLNPFIQVKPGQIFSQRLISQSTELIQLLLGEEGYAFAEVNPVPELDKENKEVAITFYIDPKNRVYVRSINFNGASSVNDEVFRREVRQFEGSYLSNSRLERSKIRIQRLPYIEAVNVSTTPVAGTPDLVDVDFDIKEGLPGQFGGGLGYSDAQKLMLNLNFVHTNFMGTGNRIAANINTGKFSKAYSVSHTDPYTTIDEVSRTVSFTYRNITQFTSSSSDFSTETIAASVEYGYPVTEYQRVILGFSWQKAQLLADPNGSSVQAFQWVNNNGNECSTGTIITCSEFNTFELIAGWIKDTRNRSLFANRGSQHRVTLTGTIPGSDVEYYTFNYHFRQYVPLGRWFTLSINADLGFGDSFGDTTSIAPFKQYFAGGPNTVRGFKEDTLGPIDSRGNPYGGNMLVAAQTEIILPMPQKWASRARFTAFFDVGNVFSTGGVDFWGPPGFPGPNGGVPTGYKFDADELKQSVGIAAQWLAPMGLFRFSYAFPLNDSERTPFRFADQVEQFQFSIGGAF